VSLPLQTISRLSTNNLAGKLHKSQAPRQAQIKSFYHHNKIIYPKLLVLSQIYSTFGTYSKE